MLTQQDMPEQGMHTIPGLQFYCMTPYDASFKGVHILFDKENVQNTLGEYLAANDLSLKVLLYIKICVMILLFRIIFKKGIII